MPSAAAAKLEKQASTEAVEPIRQGIVIIEHKIRNLEKRKRKIESYREEQKNGKDLNSDQLAAVSKYDEVQQTLEFARDLCKQFNGIAVDAAKQHKKQARKEALERAQQEVAKVREILMVQDVLQNMGQDSVREDFLAGRNGAALLGEEDLKHLDDLYSEVSPKHGGEDPRPFQEQLQTCAEHLLNIVEGKGKEIVGTTYAKLKELVTTIQACGYFDQAPETTEEINEQTTEAEVGVQEAVEEEAYLAEAPPTDTFPPQVMAPASTPASTSTMAPQSSAPVESSYFSTAAPTFVPAQAPTRPLNEVIGSVNSSFNFLQESELDSPDLSSMLTTAQQPTPPPSGPVPVAPIPSQTFTNQNFASVSTSNVPQQVVYQASPELAQTHIPGFATATPNPPPPIPMPPSHQVAPAVYSSQPAPAQPSPYPPPQEAVESEQATEQIEDSTDDWGQSDNNQNDWSQQTESQNDWSQQTEAAGDWASSTGNQNDAFITQSSTRVYGSGGGRGRMNRGSSRGSSNGYSGSRGRGNYQNGRSYGYRSNEGGNNNYYQNGYQQRENFGGNNSFGGGYKRGGRGGGGPGRGNGDRGGPRGGNARGSRGGSYVRGGNKQ